MLCSIASNFASAPAWHQILFGLAAVAGASTILHTSALKKTSKDCSTICKEIRDVLARAWLISSGLPV
ncbi:hypothetical protein ACIBQX_18380 [Nonomuraea sp. NPDC049714]|uniref:hypothetical protein n=1 Tax=Nonomuraea sp. NPDC049714 TaxID=3364357 RepID=UPI00378A155A